MDLRSDNVFVDALSGHHTRRATVRRLVVGGGTVVLAAGGPVRVAAQEADECVAKAPAAQDGIGFVPLLVGGIIQDMPTGPVDVHISRFTLEPGAEVPMAPQPYAQLVYVETGELTCPDNPGKLMYGPDGMVMYETTGGTNGTPAPPG